MEKTQYVLETIKAIKGHVKAKNDRLAFYRDNSYRLEKLTWQQIKAFNFTAEVLNLTKTMKVAEKIYAGKYTARHVKKLLGI